MAISKTYCGLSDSVPPTKERIIARKRITSWHINVCIYHMFSKLPLRFCFNFLKNDGDKPVIFLN